MSLYVPKVIGHRGAKAYAPENTLSSIHAAADIGCEWVEVDVKLTKDGVAIVFHDDDLDRTTSGSGPVAQTDWKTISELDAGSWFGESFLNERVPTLEQVLDVVQERGMGINIEIKPCPRREKETAEVALDVATRIWDEDTPPPLISSFQAVSLETALDMIPDWPRGFLMDEHQDNWQDMVKYLEAATININGNTATEEQVDSYIETQLPVLAYTINDPARAKELLRWGVDGFFCDNPDTLLEELQTRH